MAYTLCLYEELTKQSQNPSSPDYVNLGTVNMWLVTGPFDGKVSGALDFKSEWFIVYLSRAQTNTYPHTRDEASEDRQKVWRWQERMSTTRQPQKSVP